VASDTAACAAQNGRALGSVAPAGAASDRQLELAAALQQILLGAAGISNGGGSAESRAACEAYVDAVQRLMESNNAYISEVCSRVDFRMSFICACEARSRACVHTFLMVMSSPMRICRDITSLECYATQARVLSAWTRDTTKHTYQLPKGDTELAVCAAVVAEDRRRERAPGPPAEAGRAAGSAGHDGQGRRQP